MVVQRKHAFQFTWNNYPPNWEKILLAVCKAEKVQFCVGGREVGAQEGTEHIQGHFDLRRNFPRTISSLQKRIQKHSHGLMKCWIGDFESAEHCINNRNYCYKDDVVPFEYGTPPPGKGYRSTLHAAMAAVAEGIDRLPLMEEFPEVCSRYSTFLSRYRLLKVGRTLRTLGHDRRTMTNLWITGDPDVGKSEPFRSCGSSYPKNPYTKWWDGYTHDPIVLLEDVDSVNQSLAYNLKIWGDRYPFIAEVKNFTYMVRPQAVIVTSNYSMRELISPPTHVVDEVSQYDPHKEMKLRALRDRFFELHVVKCSDMNVPEGKTCSQVMHRAELPDISKCCTHYLRDWCSIFNEISFINDHHPEESEGGDTPGP